MRLYLMCGTITSRLTTGMSFLYGLLRFGDGRSSSATGSAWGVCQSTESGNTKTAHRHHTSASTRIRCAPVHHHHQQHLANHNRGQQTGTAHDTTSLNVSTYNADDGQAPSRRGWHVEMELKVSKQKPRRCKLLRAPALHHKIRQSHARMLWRGLQAHHE